MTNTYNTSEASPASILDYSAQDECKRVISAKERAQEWDRNPLIAARFPCAPRITMNSTVSVKLLFTGINFITPSISLRHFFK